MIHVRPAGRNAFKVHHATRAPDGSLSTLCGRPNARHTSALEPTTALVSCRCCQRTARDLRGASRATPRLQALVRSDLARVARLTGLPEGYGPSVDVYREHGAVGVSKLQGLVRGWGRKKPRASWTEALRFFGFKPQGPNGTALVSRGLLLEDLRRVAGLLGGRVPSRSEYERLGRFSPGTVYRHLGGADRQAGRCGSWVSAMREVFPTADAYLDDYLLAQMHATISAEGPLKWERHKAEHARRSA